MSEQLGLQGLSSALGLADGGVNSRSRAQQRQRLLHISTTHHLTQPLRSTQASASRPGLIHRARVVFTGWPGQAASGLWRAGELCSKVLCCIWRGWTPASDLERRQGRSAPSEGCCEPKHCGRLYCHTAQTTGDMRHVSRLTERNSIDVADIKQIQLQFNVEWCKVHWLWSKLGSSIKQKTMVSLFSLSSVK